LAVASLPQAMQVLPVAREASRIRRVRLDTVPMMVEHERSVTGLEVLRLPDEFLGS